MHNGILRSSITVSLIILYLFVAALIAAASTHAQNTSNANQIQNIVFNEMPSSDLSKPDIDSVIKSLPEHKLPLWPVAAFLYAEKLYHDKKHQIAARIYEHLVEATTNSNASKAFGHTGLSIVAFWRLANILERDKNVARSAVKDLLRHKKKLFASLATKLMWKNSFHAAVPDLRDQIYIVLHRLAVKHNFPDIANGLLYEYYPSSRYTSLPSQMQKVIEVRIANNTMTRDNFFLIRAKGFYRSKLYDKADIMLQNIRRSSNNRTRSKALLLTAKIQEDRGDQNRSVRNTLTELLESNPDISVEGEARYRRAIVNKKMGETKLSERDFHLIYRKFPGGLEADDALIELARAYQMDGRFKEAIEFFDKSIQFPGENDWFWTARYQKALTFYIRSKIEQNENFKLAALKIFSNLVSEYTKAKSKDLADLKNDPVTFRAPLFWKARLLSESSLESEKSEARRLFGFLATNYSYAYYGVRANVHLDALNENKDETRPSKTVLPTPSSQIRYHKKYVGSAIFPKEKIAASPYLDRLSWSVERNIYTLGQESKSALKAKLPDRQLQGIGFRNLARSREFSGIMLFLSLRIDALLAKRRSSRHDHVLALSAYMSYRAKDAPIGLSMIAIPNEYLGSNDAYIRTTYPPALKDQILKATNRRISDAVQIYSIVRHESIFDADALSNKSAYGLLQITPQRFENLRLDHGLAGQFERTDSYGKILFDSQTNLNLGVYHWRDVKFRYSESLVEALMVHNAGQKAVDNWKKSWRKLKLQNDVELKLETARSTETRRFVRRALAAISLVESIKLFGAHK